MDEKKNAAEEMVREEKTAETAPEEKDKKKKGEHDKYKKETEQMKKELEDIKERLLRAAAEFDNYRKRTEKEKRDSASFGSANTVEKMLPVLDTLEMAANAECKDEEYKKGVMLTVNLFTNALTNLGVTEIEALGKEFNPTVHNAVAREQSDEHESGTVVRVLQKGYKLGERIIRPAMVAVAE